MKKFYLGILLLLFLSYGSAQKIQVQKEPSWITHNVYELTSSKLEEEAEYGYLDLIYERQVSLPEQSSFIRTTSKILSEAGVQNNSEVKVSWDPSFQQLIFHTIKIIRGNRVINQLNVSKFKIVHEEEELSRFVYNGKLSAVLFLEDVRKGDIVEYSYSLKGFNPVFNGKHSEFFETNYGVPVAFMYYKLIALPAKAPAIKNIQTDIKPEIQKNNGLITYEWKLRNVFPVRIQEKTPGWFDPYGSVMISEFNNWKDVNEWGKNLFIYKEKPSDALQKKVNEIISQSTTKEQMAVSALRFVQDDIRYLGIEMGQSSHRPNSPNKVFAQRFGDCKDKSFLLCVMLRLMDISAEPVFINTDYKKTILEWLPSAISFNHVTVRIQMKGKTFYLDPTISFQRGTIENLYYPDYQVGLPLTDTTTQLCNILPHSNSIVRTREVFHLKEKDGKLEVTTTYSGKYADNLRDNIHNNSIYELKKNCREFYASYFKNISLDSLNYNEQSNGDLVANEIYTIKDVWTQKGNARSLSFSPFLINTVLEKPVDQTRTMPFKLYYPAHYIEDIEIHLSESCDFGNFSREESCSGFVIKKWVKSDGERNAVLHYEYETKKDHVLPEEINAYVSSFDQMNEHFGYDLTLGAIEKSDVATSRSTPLTVGSEPIYTYLYFLLGICVLVTYLIRRQNQRN